MSGSHAIGLINVMRMDVKAIAPTREPPSLRDCLKALRRDRCFDGRATEFGNGSLMLEVGGFNQKGTGE